MFVTYVLLGAACSVIAVALLFMGQERNSALFLLSSTVFIYLAVWQSRRRG